MAPSHDYRVLKVTDQGLSEAGCNTQCGGISTAIISFHCVSQRLLQPTKKFAKKTTF
jgi:hypothetical protein